MRSNWCPVLFTHCWSPRQGVPGPEVVGRRGRVRRTVRRHATQTRILHRTVPEPRHDAGQAARHQDARDDPTRGATRETAGTEYRHCKAAGQPGSHHARDGQTSSVRATAEGETGSTVGVGHGDLMGDDQVVRLSVVRRVTWPPGNWSSGKVATDPISGGDRS